MKKTKTSSYVLTLKLNTDASDEAFLNKRFFLSCKIHNRLVSHVRKQLSKMLSDYRYRQLLEQWHKTRNGHDVETKHQHSVIGKQLGQIRLEYGLSEYQLHKYVKIQQHRYAFYLGSQCCQRIASAVWKSVESYLFKNGKYIHFHKSTNFSILYGANTNTTYMIFYEQRKLVRIGKNYEIPVDIDYNDLYVCYALQDKIKYCQIVRKMFSNGYHYYLQLVMEGVPPKKHIISDGRVGIDIGTSSVAVSSEYEVKLNTLGQNTPDYSAKIHRLQRTMDRSKRMMNPNKYNEDGSIKRGNHDKWIFSKSYKKLSNQKRILERKQAAALKQSHEILANDIIAMGNDIYVETMNFKALQKRKKETTRSKTGKFHRKGRFGRSIKSHAPAMLISIINRKLSYQGLEIHKINTQTFRASQYNHITDEYVKKKLGNRSTLIGNMKIQRDLYSAFLLMNSALDLLQTDRNRCMETFDRFVTLHNLYMENLVAQYRNGIKFPTCMGIADFAA